MQNKRDEVAATLATAQAENQTNQDQIASLKVLVVDDEHYMRKVVRTMLLAIGVKTVIEADDGMSGLEAIKKHMPNIVVVDWEMPLIDGAQFVRMVRSPMDFPAPDVPIISAGSTTEANVTSSTVFTTGDLNVIAHSRLQIGGDPLGIVSGAVVVGGGTAAKGRLRSATRPMYWT